MSTMIKNLVTSNLAKAFDGALQDAVQLFTGSRKGTGGYYDPEIGDYVGSADITYSGRGVFGSYNSEEIQSTQIDINDIKLTCLQSEVNETPEIDDIIVHDGKEHNVIEVGQDPASVTWSIQLRGIDNVG